MGIAPPEPDMTAKTQYRVGITGSYGGLNLGDEAILQFLPIVARDAT